MNIDLIDIYLISESSEGIPHTLYDTIDGGGSSYEFYGLSDKEFWSLTGGIEIVLNGYISIFRSVDFHYLVKPVEFLLKSLYTIKNIKSDWFDESVTYNEVILLTTGKNILKLRVSDPYVILSFSTVSNDIRQRGDGRYFGDLSIDLELWISATLEALAEYFKLLDQVVKVYPNTQTTITMMRFREVWRNITNEYI